MNSLQFRALLVDPGATTQERPLQVYGTSRQEIDEWARRVLAKAVSEDAAVMVYQMVETQVALIPKDVRKLGSGRKARGMASDNLKSTEESK